MPDDKNTIEPIDADFDAVAKAMTSIGETELKVPSARYGGILAIGDVQIPCYVLEDGQRVLDLAAFDARICELRDVMTDIGRTRASVDLSFIRINAQPIKQALATCVTKWIYMFTSYLQEHVVGSLQWLADFMARTRAGLREDVTADPGERQALMDVITHIRDVRRVMDRTQAMFSPLRETVHLLTKHGASFLDATVDDVPVLTYLEQAQVQTKR